MRSLSFLLFASVALTLPSFSPSPCTALRIAGPPLAATLHRNFHSMANGPTSVFIPTYGTVTLPSSVDPNLIPGYDSATSSVSNQFVQPAIEYLNQFGLIDINSSTGAFESTSGSTGTLGGIGGGPNGGITNFNSTESSSGVGGVGGGASSNNNSTGVSGSQGAPNPNGAGAKYSLSWKLGAAAVAFGLSAAAGAVGMI